MKKVMNIFTSAVIFFALLLGAFGAGFVVGKVDGYNQRRATEISISNMLADRARAMSKKRY